MNSIKHNFIGVLTVTAFVISLTSCSFDPIDKTYNKHTADDDYRRIREISNIDSIDLMLLEKYMIEHNLISPHVRESHATYLEILNEAKKEKEQYEIEKRKKGNKEIDIARSHEIEKIKNIKKVLFVDFVEQGEFNEGDFLDVPKKSKNTSATSQENKNVITYDVMFKNISSKDIKAFKGDINFYDIFHNEIKKVTFTSYKQISVGDSIVQRFIIDMAEVNKGVNKFKDLNKEFIKVEWLPDRLIHTDDEVIE